MLMPASSAPIAITASGRLDDSTAASVGFKESMGDPGLAPAADCGAPGVPGGLDDEPTRGDDFGPGV